jgi:hypothetical protein
MRMIDMSEHRAVEPGDDARAAEFVVDLITMYANRFDPVDRVTFYSEIVRGQAPVRAELETQMGGDG